MPALLPSRWRTTAFLVLLCTLVLIVPGAFTRDVDEQQLKAATIVSMLRLVSWRAPLPAGAPLAVTVVGDTRLADALRDASTGQTVDGRALVVTHVASLAQVPDTAPPVIVLAAGQRTAAPVAARALGSRGVLTIGEGEGMGQAGLVLGVYLAGDRIRFDANTGAAERAGLTLSSHLLRLARIVG